MNDFSYARVLAERLRVAVEESLILRAQLKATMDRTRTLVDKYNEELRRTIVWEAASGLREAKVKPVAVPFPRPTVSAL